MKVYLDPIKLLQEGEITQHECERIKSLSSKWDSPFIPCIPVALAMTFVTLVVVSPFIVFSPIVILLGVLLLLLGGRTTNG